MVITQQAWTHVQAGFSRQGRHIRLVLVGKGRRESPSCLPEYQWTGGRENLQETTEFNHKEHGFLQIPLEPIH